MLTIDFCKDEAMSTEADSYPSSYLINCADEADGANERKREVGGPVVVEELTMLETKKVRRWRIMVFAVLLLSTLVLGVVIYFYSSGKEHYLMSKNIIADSRKILGDFGTSMAITMGSVDSLAVTMVSVARATNQSWPFVTIPDFEVRSSKIRFLSKALYVTLSPIVTSEERAAWENYTSENNHWINESLAVQERDYSYSGPIIWDYENYDTLHNVSKSNDEAVAIGINSPGPFVPAWQTSPCIPHHPVYNWDLLSVSSDALDAAFNSHRAVISTPSLITDYKNQGNEADIDVQGHDLAAAEYSLSLLQAVGEPASVIHYPILAGAADSVSMSNTSAGSSFVGFLSLTIVWRDMLTNILPDTSWGMIVVFENPCSQSFTYQINGPDAVLLGVGDLHDSKYDSYEHSTRLVDLSSATIPAGVSTWIPLNEDYCQYTLRLFPSHIVETKNLSWCPVAFTLMIVLFFGFISGVFYLYSCWVERRQRMVIEMVKERSQTLEVTNKRLEEANRRVTHASALQLRHFACMSHEIRTPLNAVVGLAGLLLGSPLDPSQKESVKLIVSSGELLQAIVDDVLDYAKLESGNVDIDVKPSNLQDVLAFVVSSMQVKAKSMSKNLSIQTFFDADVAEIFNTDSLRLQQILFNLLSNAVKFSKDDGIVELSASICSPEDTLEDYEQLTESSATVIRFIVKDYGKGIGRENFKKIFRPFLQEKMSDAAEGTGLGLAITKKLVERLGGKISVDSRVGQWSKFTVDLPYDGSPPDVDSISKQFPNVSVFLLDHDAQCARQITKAFEHFMVDFTWFPTLYDFEMRLKTIDSSADTRFVCLSREDMCDPAVLSPFGSKFTLITFGERKNVIRAVHHFASLTELLPSVLMSSIIEILRSPHTAGRRSTYNPPSGSRLPELRILIAEDNKINQKVLKRILDRLEINNVEIVDNGQLAVEREAEKEFDVVLMDMQMPVMDGIEACRLITAREGGHPRAKVVFVTASVSHELKAACVEAGASDFLAKPCNVNTVQACLNKLVASLFQDDLSDDGLLDV